MNRLRLPLFIVVCLGLAWLGCTSVVEKIVEKPKIALSGVAVKDVTADGATVVFGVQVDNPNAFALKVDSVRYDVEMGGKPLGSGKLEHPAEVAAKSKAVVDVPVPVKFSDLFASVLDLMSKPSTTYRVHGDASFGVLTIPFDQSGDVKLR